MYGGILSTTAFNPQPFVFYGTDLRTILGNNPSRRLLGLFSTLIGNYLFIFSLDMSTKALEPKASVNNIH